MVFQDRSPIAGPVYFNKSLSTEKVVCQDRWTPDRELCMGQEGKTKDEKGRSQERKIQDQKVRYKTRKEDTISQERKIQNKKGRYKKSRKEDTRQERHKTRKTLIRKEYERKIQEDKKGRQHPCSLILRCANRREKRAVGCDRTHNAVKCYHDNRRRECKSGIEKTEPDPETRTWHKQRRRAASLKHRTAGRDWSTEFPEPLTMNKRTRWTSIFLRDLDTIQVLVARSLTGNASWLIYSIHCASDTVVSDAGNRLISRKEFKK